MSKNLEARKVMGYSGYYLQSDIAKFKNVSRQFINKTINDYQTIKYLDKTYLKYDNGEKAVDLFGKNPLDVFLNHNFKKRTKFTLSSNNCVVDIKLLEKDNICIRFYNDNGECISLISNLKTIEFF